MGKTKKLKWRAKAAFSGISPEAASPGLQRIHLNIQPGKRLRGTGSRIWGQNYPIWR